MNIYGTKHGNILEAVIEKCLVAALGNRDVAVCGLEILSNSEEAAIRIDLCYNSNEDIDPRSTIALLDVIKKSFMAIGETRPPVIYHNLPDTIKIHA